MTERENVHGIIFSVMQVQCHVTRISEGNHKFAQFGRAAQWASNGGSLFETEELPGDDLSCASCSFRGFARGKSPAALQASNGALGDDQSWHPGTGFSSSVPQLSSHVRTSSPFK